MSITSFVDAKLQETLGFSYETMAIVLILLIMFIMSAKDMRLAIFTGLIFFALLYVFLNSYKALVFLAASVVALSLSIFLSYKRTMAGVY